VGCGVRVFTRNNRVVKIEGDWDSPVNAGTMCKNGRFIPLEDNRDRITTPLIRVNGQLTPASWGMAYVNIVEHLKDGVAALASTRLSTEALSTFKALFADGLKSGMVTSLEEGYPTAMQAGLAEKEGKQLEGKLELLRRSDCVLVVGSDLYHHHEVAGFMIKRSLAKGTKLIVINSEETDFTDLANVFLKVKPGNDADVLKAIETVITNEKLARNPEAAKVDESALARSGMKAADVSEAAHILAQSVAPVLVYGKGLSGADTAEGLETLLRVARVIGAVDEERVGVISLKGEANSMSASQLKLDKPFNMDGEKAVFVALGDGFISKRMVERLEKAPYLVVQASYASPLTQNADVVLPSANWAEEDGHYLNLEGRLQEKVRVVDAPEGVRDNVTVLAGLAEHLGVKLPGEWKSQLDERTAVTELVLN
jgi:formate dehydrogenase major subunit